MECIDFFGPHLDWLRGNPPPQPPDENRVLFRMTGNRDEANRFVFFASGVFSLQGFSLVAEGINVLFSDRSTEIVGPFSQPFSVSQPEVNGIRLRLPGGPDAPSLERVNQDLSGNLIARYSTLECRDNGLLVCTSEFTREIVILSLEDFVFSPPEGIP